MERNLYIDASHPNETRVVLKSEENIEDYEYESKKNILVKNNIYLGKVSRVEPSLQATFVDFGRERHGFLAFNDIQPDYYQIPQSDIQKLKQKEEELREKLKEESKKLEESDSPTILNEDFRNSENEFNNVDVTNSEGLNPANNELNPIKNVIDRNINETINIEKKFDNTEDLFFAIHSRYSTLLEDEIRKLMPQKAHQMVRMHLFLAINNTLNGMVDQDLLWRLPDLEGKKSNFRLDYEEFAKGFISYISAGIQAG